MEFFLIGQYSFNREKYQEIILVGSKIWGKRTGTECIFCWVVGGGWWVVGGVLFFVHTPER